MGDVSEPTDLEALLDRIEEAADDDERVKLGAILEVVGRRSFGPLLLLAGIVMVAPVIGDIPGVPSIMGLFILLITVQLLLQRDHFWLPGWLLNRSVDRHKLCKGLGWMRRPARWVDRLLRPRLTFLTHRAGRHLVAVACALIALATPAMEVVPLSANFAGAAVTAFGLSLIAHDGLVALIAFAFTATTAGFMIQHLVG